MDRSSDDSPPVPPARRSGSAMPPFSAPRPDEGKPLPPAQRRSTPLFVPPSPAVDDEEDAAVPPPVAPRRPPTPATSAKAPVTAAPSAPAITPPAFEPVQGAAPAAEEPPPEKRDLGVENLEPEEIALQITGERPAIGDAQIDVIAYDEANGELRADAGEGKRPQVDGLELESTELNLEPSGNAPSPPAGLEIESFWAAEAFTPSTRPLATPPEAAEPVMPAYTEPPAAAPPRRSSIESLRVEEVMPPRLPTPPNVRSVAPRGGRSATPVSAAKAMPPADVRTPRQLEALKELEPWAPPSAVPAADPQHLVAEALERVARRIRAGDVSLNDDANAATDENALSAALQALVRAPRR
jgi:hypothetical protein